jgi:hypothetical protein
MVFVQKLPKDVVTHLAQWITVKAEAQIQDGQFLRIFKMIRIEFDHINEEPRTKNRPRFKKTCSKGHVFN